VASALTERRARAVEQAPVERCLLLRAPAAGRGGGGGLRDARGVLRGEANRDARADAVDGGAEQRRCANAEHCYDLARRAGTCGVRVALRGADV
jgi:hypothetical protein